MKARNRGRLLVRTAVVLCCLALGGGCASTGKHANDNAEFVSLFKSWQPQLLYLLPSPYPRLYVEVDAVEGSVPSEAALNRLRDFLSAHCNKPGGIEIVRREVIPIQAARGLSARALAREYMQGPPPSTNGPPAAFLYLLFYNDALCYPPHSPHHPTAHPCTDLLPYPGVYMNTGYLPKMMQKDGLIHEGGHALGLAGRPDHAAGFHCLDPSCLMHASLSLHRWLFGQQRGLCPRCQKELADSLQQPSPSNLRFVGSVFVRSEAGYHILALPNRSKLIVGDLVEEDCRNFAAAAHSETPASGDEETSLGWQLSWVVKDGALRDPVSLRRMMDRIKEDPIDPVRIGGLKVLAQASASRYCALGQFTNAIEVLRQAIRANPEDDLSYKLLAWTKATCPDQAVRDGKEAVAAARKACEITKWKTGSWIDTLAAACAEAGDFTNAVHFEEQALSTGSPTESEQKDMQGRLSLYKQSQPFRQDP